MALGGASLANDGDRREQAGLDAMEIISDLSEKQHLDALDRGNALLMLENLAKYPHLGLALEQQLVERLITVMKQKISAADRISLILATNHPEEQATEKHMQLGKFYLDLEVYSGRELRRLKTHQGELLAGNSSSH